MSVHTFIHTCIRIYVYTHACTRVDIQQNMTTRQIVHNLNLCRLQVRDKLRIRGMPNTPHVRLHVTEPLRCY